LNIKEKVIDKERHTYVLKLILALKEQVNFKWTDEFIWHKSTAYPGKWSNRFRDAWERLLHFTKEKEFKMNQESVMIPISQSSKERMKRLCHNDFKNLYSKTGSGFMMNRSNLIGKDFSYPTNVIYGSPATNPSWHSAIFPEWLPEFFIKLFTDKGDIVLDPFLGSGTTYKVARKMNRIAIGIEINKEYVNEHLKKLEFMSFNLDLFE
jgi:DNA modification methylase